MKTIVLFLIFIWFPVMLVTGWKLAKKQQAFIKYVKSNYQDTWRSILPVDPYSEKSLVPGLVRLSTSYLTEEDFSDEYIKKEKAKLKKVEFFNFGLFVIGAVLFAYLLFS